MAAARGAYAIICQDGRAYVGGSKSIIRRWAGHKSLLSGKKHPNRKLQDAWIEQGSEAFTFVVLEIVSPDADLIAVEQKWIDRLDSAKTGFNLAPNAGSSLGHKLTAEMRQNLSDARRGKPKSAAHRAAISVSKSGEKSPAAKLKETDVIEIRRLAANGVARRDLAAQFGICYMTVSNVVRHKCWRYVEQKEAL